MHGAIRFAACCWRCRRALPAQIVAQRVAAAPRRHRPSQLRGPAGACAATAPTASRSWTTMTRSGRATASAGPVRVSLEWSADGVVTDAHTYVGGRWRSGHRPASPTSAPLPAAPGGRGPPRAGRARRRRRRGPHHRRHAGRQRGRLAGLLRLARRPDGAARDSEARGLLARPGRGRGRHPRASTRSSADDSGRSRGAKAGRVRPLAAARGRRRPGAHPDRAHEPAPGAAARRPSSGSGRARTRGRSRCSRSCCRVT